MKLEDLRNPLPDTKKAYPPNFSNTGNNFSDEKGAAMLSEFSWLKWLLPLVLPDWTDTFIPDLFDFDKPTADDDMLDPWYDPITNPDSLSPWDDGYFDDPIDITNPGPGRRGPGGPPIDDEPNPDWHPDWWVTPEDLYDPDAIDDIDFTPPPPPPPQPPTGPGSHPMHP
jgi:hypothetical protein